MYRGPRYFRILQAKVEGTLGEQLLANGDYFRMVRKRWQVTLVSDCILHIQKWPQMMVLSSAIRLMVVPLFPLLMLR